MLEAKRAEQGEGNKGRLLKIVLTPLENAARAARRFPLWRTLLGISLLLEANEAWVHQADADTQIQTINCTSGPSISLTKDYIRSDNLDSTQVEVTFRDECLPGLIGMSAVASSITETVNYTPVTDWVNMTRSDIPIAFHSTADKHIFLSDSIRDDASVYKNPPYNGDSHVSEIPAIRNGSFEVDYADATRRYNMLPLWMYVVDNTIAEQPPLQCTPNISVQDYVVNITTDENASLRDVVRQFYNLLPLTNKDPVDQIVVSIKDKQLTLDPNDSANMADGGANTFRVIGGTGAPGSTTDPDPGGGWGSKYGELSEVAEVVGPGRENTIDHERGRVGVAYLNNVGLSSNGDWLHNNNLGPGMMGGGLAWVSDGTGGFTTVAPAGGGGIKFSGLEEALLGMKPMDQVGEIVVALDHNQTFDRVSTDIHGPFQFINPSVDITQAYGPVTPTEPLDMRNIKSAYIAWTIGNPLTPLEIAGRNRILAQEQVDWPDKTDHLSQLQNVQWSQCPDDIASASQDQTPDQSATQSDSPLIKAKELDSKRNDHLGYVSVALVQAYLRRRELEELVA